MILFDAQRLSDSPFVERVWSSHTEGTHPFLSIAVNRLELVVSRIRGEITMSVRGPETRATPVGDSPEEGEWVGILLKPGVSMPHLPLKALVDGAVDLPTASHGSFWLGGSAWQFPGYGNADTFVDRLAKEGLLLRDPLIEEVLYGRLNDLTSRSVQYRFLRSTGITQNAMRQIERARAATFLLQQGLSIPDVIARTGYYDQPHLNRSLRHYIGQTPAQLLRRSQPEQLSFLYKTTPFPMRHNILVEVDQKGRHVTAEPPVRLLAN